MMKENAYAIIRLYNRNVFLKSYGFDKCVAICNHFTKGNDVNKNGFEFFRQKFNESLIKDEKFSISYLSSKYRSRHPDLKIDQVFEIYFQETDDALFEWIGRIAK